MLPSAVASIERSVAQLVCGVPPADPVSLAHITISWLVLTFLLAVLYKLLPDTLLAWRDIWGGAAPFLPGRRLIGPYLRESPIGSGYNTAGALIVAPVRVSCSAMLRFGACRDAARAGRAGIRRRRRGR